MLALFFSVRSGVLAAETSLPTNKFGIHLAVPSDEDIARAATLVNGQDGAYGYLTLVIHDDQRDVQYWQDVFNKLRRAKLIPIVRLATHPEGENWKAPSVDDAEGWASFLNSLNWVTQERHVILFNEPNHAAEWGGNVNAEQYGLVARAFVAKLKAASPDFVIMLAGLDLAAPQALPTYGDAYTFLQNATSALCRGRTQSACSADIDAISSHAYPNPGFVGSPYDTGRTSIRGYEAEITWFKTFFGKEYPVYITETGWDSNKIAPTTVASYFQYAFTAVWLPDDRVRAVTPFILNYQGEPFLGFSFLDLSTAQPKPQYTAIKNMQKVYGQPRVRDTALLVERDNTLDLVESSRTPIFVTVTNTGQAVWETGLYALQAESTLNNVVGNTIVPFAVEPGRSITLSLTLTTTAVPRDQKSEVTIAFRKIKDTPVRTIASLTKSITIHEKPSARVTAQLFSKGLSTGSDFELQVFDERERLVFRQKKFPITLGVGTIEGLPDVVPGKTYRFVLLKPYYLPRQIVQKVVDGENALAFDTLVPLDFDEDGALTIGDVRGLFVQRAHRDMSFSQKFNLLLPF